MLAMTFYQCYKTTHDLNYAYEPDFDRDVSYAITLTNGHFGTDPTYKNEYLWYNPLLSSIEAAIGKFTSTPLNIVATRAGAYLNIFAPITFFLMMLIIFGAEIALASLLSYLFFSMGNILSWGAATYSPWLYPVCFSQFLFYLNIASCYKAFSTQKNKWFILLGIGIGVNFLGHTAPALIMILMLLLLQLQNIFHSIKEKNYLQIRVYVFQGIITFIPFVIIAMPFLYFIIGKYHMHMINRSPFEYTEGMFYLSHYKDMIKANVSVSFLIAVVGFLWFYLKFHQSVVRRIFLGWLIVCVFMYFYSTLVAFLDYRYKIKLMGTVPSFHYFYYLKALQSVFFGMGIWFLFCRTIEYIKMRGLINLKNQAEIVFTLLLLTCSFVYYPFYKNRNDFTVLREKALEKESNKDLIRMHDYILKNIPAEKVILCGGEVPVQYSVMSTARKMVSIISEFSNPYVDFEKREKDKNDMFQFLISGKPAGVSNLFKRYDVSFVVFTSKELDSMIAAGASTGVSKLIYKNDSYSIYSINL